MLKYLRRGSGLAGTLRRNAIRRGLLGGSTPWLVVLALGLLRRSAGKVLKRGEMPVVFSEKLKPGQGLTITHVKPARRDRRSKS